jgi:hypothetical protein
MIFIEGKLFHDKRNNLTFYKKTWVRFYWHQFWWHLLDGSSSTIRDVTWSFIRVLIRFYCHEVVMTFIEGDSSTIRGPTWPFTKDSWLILLSRSRDDIYWKELFRDKRSNLTFYGMLSIDFIATDSWWYLLKGCSSAIKEATWSFTKGCRLILLTQCRDGIYWRGDYTIREGIWQFTKGYWSILFARRRDGIYWIGAFSR